MGGAGVWDVLLPAPGEISESYLESVGRLEEALRGIRDPAVHKVVSLVEAEKGAHQSAFGFEVAVAVETGRNEGRDP